MRLPILRRIEVALAVGGIAGLLAGCSSVANSASVTGHVLRYAPAITVEAPSTTLPVAWGLSTVQAVSSGKVFAVQKVPSGSRFHFTLPLGNYDLIVTDDTTCHATVALRFNTTTHANVRCVEP